jgi:uncharacterized cofD-like protein
MDKPKIVVIGGGTGLSVLLRGLKHFPLDITAIVTVADDGGSTGRLRKEFNIPAIGDLRNVIVSLSETEDVVEELMQYRFHTSSDLDGHPTGNLLLTALYDITGSLVNALEAMSQVLNVKGLVLPSTEDPVDLVGHMKDGSVIIGESRITKSEQKIDYIEYKDEPTPVPEVLEAIEEADLIVLGIGSLYTSVVPNIIPKKTKEALIKSKARKLYVCNAMTEHGETDEFYASDYIKVINKHVGKKIVDGIIVNDLTIPKHILDLYKEEAATPVLVDEVELARLGVEVIKGRLVTFDNNVVRHNAIKLASTLFDYAINER